MEGMTPEENEIYFQLFPDEFLKVLKPAIRAKSIKMKLTKKGQPPCPHLTVEIKLVCSLFCIIFTLLILCC